MGLPRETSPASPDHMSLVDNWNDSISEDDISFSMALDPRLNGQDMTHSPVTLPELLYPDSPSWEMPPPAPQVEFSADMAFNLNALKSAEGQRLLAVAIGTGLAPSSTRSGTSAGSSFEQSPTMASDSYSISPGGKDKHSHSKSASRSGSTSSRTAPKTARKQPNDRNRHNDIERKYRNNLKDRIADLREAVPSLQSIVEDADCDDDDDMNPISSPTIVSKVKS
jgi:hypothetical protein